MAMEYEVLETESPDVWLLRIFGDNLLCGKLRVGTTVKDDLVAKFIELGWTERT